MDAIRWDSDRGARAADALVHGVGLAGASAGTAVLLSATAGGTGGRFAAALVYAGGLLAALLASALYNLWPVGRVKGVLRRVDHAAIFLLIAGTYTPFLAERPAGPVTTALVAGMWTLALAGVVLKAAFTGRADRAAVLVYLALGWSGVAVWPLIAPVLSGEVAWLLLLGGLAYSAGVLFHLSQRLRFQTALWHACVVVGAGLHFAAVHLCLTGA